MWNQHLNATAQYISIHVLFENYINEQKNYLGTLLRHQSTQIVA